MRFLCGLFYGALLYGAWLKERDRRRLSRLLKDVSAAIKGTEWDLENGLLHSAYLKKAQEEAACDCDEPCEDCQCEEPVLKSGIEWMMETPGPKKYVMGGIGSGLPCTCDTHGDQCRATFHAMSSWPGDKKA